ncbi:hypothetical protein [Flavobacterium sp.]|jgi:hypothetical protein|uniref:hypothetical protein n=1 Tax=Flavobacterium sp. TaxID=239 RepID=UPI0037BE8591
MKKILFIILIASVFGCSNDDSNTTNSNDLIQNYYYNYMLYPGRILQNNSSDNKVKFEYDSNNSIKKRIGGMTPLDQSTGYDYTFVETIFDQLTYLPNQIFIEKKTTSNIVTVLKFERKLFLDSQNRILKKAVYRENAFPERDTTYYTYNSNGILKESSKTINNEFENSIYYFNQSNNIDSIVTKKFLNSNLILKTVEIFSEYDNAENPLKNLLIFEETFYRALSKNNFKRYDKREYNPANELTGTSFRTWNFIYDSNGKVKFDQF